MIHPQKKPALFVLMTFIFLISGVVPMSAKQPGVDSLLPAAEGNWRIGQDDQFYDPDNLYNYIDGGAELYLSYGSVRLASRTYSQDGQPDIILDLFDMGNSRDAFGVFSHARETIDTTFGQGSQYNPGLLLFWKDRFFISILGSPSTGESEQFIYALARSIEASIPHRGELPVILNLLPQEALMEESVKYFHHYIWLNTYYFIADHNLLHINKSTDAVLAKYREPGGHSLLLLLEYQTTEEADAAYTDFIREYLPEYSGKGAIQLEDSSWSGCEKAGTLLSIVLNAGSTGITERLLGEVRSKAAAFENQRDIK